MQELKFSGFVKHLMGGVLCFLIRSKIFLASRVESWGQGGHGPPNDSVFFWKQWCLETFCLRTQVWLPKVQFLNIAPPPTQSPHLDPPLPASPVFLQLASEAQPACVSLKFLNCCFILASCFLGTLFHRNTCYLLVKLKDWTNIFSTQAIFCTF